MWDIWPHPTGPNDRVPYIYMNARWDMTRRGYYYVYNSSTEGHSLYSLQTKQSSFLFKENM